MIFFCGPLSFLFFYRCRCTCLFAVGAVLLKGSIFISESPMAQPSFEKVTELIACCQGSCLNENQKYVLDHDKVQAVV